MTLRELKQIVDRTILRRGNDELDVVIPNHKPSMGGISTTNVRGANQGIDWNRGMFILWPDKKMVEKEEETK